MRLYEIKGFDNIEISNFKEFYRFLTPNYRTGWLTPENNLVIVQGYRHLDYIGEFSLHDEQLFKINLNPELKQKIIDLWENAKEEYWEIERNYADSLDPDEHPAWHNMDMAGYSIEDEYQKETLNLLYDYSWSRIGMLTRKKGLGGGPGANTGKLKITENNKFIMELETKNDNHIRPAKKLAKALDAELIITKR